ncbi:MAG: thiol-disulfide oxidoreductase DCC family protein [Gemmatimonadales bacterium]
MTASILVFDGECAFCCRSIKLLRRWDKDGRLSYVPFQDSEALASLPPMPRRDLEQAMHLVAGPSVLRGAAAVPAILRLLPGGTPLALLYRLPGVPWLAERVYATIARNRHRLGCGSGTCTLG